jgi:hypothetical protein
VLDDVDERDQIETAVFERGVRIHALHDVDAVVASRSFDQPRTGLDPRGVETQRCSLFYQEPSPGADIQKRGGVRLLPHRVADQPAHLEDPRLLAILVSGVLEALV